MLPEIFWFACLIFSGVDSIPSVMLARTELGHKFVVRFVSVIIKKEVHACLGMITLCYFHEVKVLGAGVMQQEVEAILEEQALVYVGPSSK